MSQKDSVSNPDKPQTFISHLVEIRQRLLIIVAAVFVVFLILFSFAGDLYSFVAQPLLRYLPEGSSMIATQVASPFLTPFKLSMVLAIFITIPLILYQIWAFVAPGLYEHEKSLVSPLLIASTLLFYLGAAFAYYVIFPVIFEFFMSISLDGVTQMTDITDYLDFVLKMFLAFGIAFEVPVVIILLVRMGIMSVQALSEKRPFVIVGSFVFGMLITPPDVLSQILLALPMWVLFELGLIIARGIKPKENDLIDS